MDDMMNDILRLCCELSADKQIKAAFKNSVKGAAAAGGGAFVGGLLGGPVGIALGGAVGGALGAWMTSGQFRPLPEILMELSPIQQEKLCSDVKTALGTLKWTDVVHLLTQVRENGVLQQKVLGAIMSYTKNELKAEVQYVD
ncbi:protein C19orf12 homolog [Misgurnus anguillicaudatus]|uniref:protein C19orf12 homolog n=1 Tax=Misgurnus anguillicaudatus TaxID=75329 RepID=UPI003CCFA954